ncbi:MAG: carbon-nitrogen hydrolase family protein [Tepidisphaerales bacterium]
MGDDTFKLGMGQILVEGGRVEANLARAEAMIGAAAEAGCRVVVLPECLDLGWLDESATDHAEEIPGPRSQRLAVAARRHGMFVAAGLTERAGDLCYNAAILLGPDGRLLLKHRKINELRFGPPHDRYATGNMLGVVQTELGCIGLNICADNFPASLVLGHSLARMGARIILSPCAWAVPPEHDNQRTPYGQEWVDPYAELARTHALSIVGVSCVGRLTSGPWKGHRCIGNSLAMGRGGRILAWGPHGVDAEELVVVSMEL